MCVYICMCVCVCGGGGVRACDCVCIYTHIHILVQLHMQRTLVRFLRRRIEPLQRTHSLIIQCTTTGISQVYDVLFLESTYKISLANGKSSIPVRFFYKTTSKHYSMCDIKFCVKLWWCRLTN